MTLPSSIEAHLSEAGFTQTELLILRYCIDGSAYSLRELAAQTKKSTGVLDQAMKKLLRRKIMTRRTVNGTKKYALYSMDAVLQWIEEDVQRQTESLKRRKQDFTSFIRTLQQHEAQPKVEYFEGEEGIARAYQQLLEQKPDELLQFLPLDCHEDAHVFEEARQEFHKRRRALGVGLRVIAHNTVYGKRFRERDPLEQRETKLVHPKRCAIDFEKIIAGNTVACFNDAEKTAYFIHFPELAHSEANMFEMVWGDERLAAKPANAEAETGEPAPWYAIFRPNRIEVALLVVAAVLTGALTYAEYNQRYHANTERIRDRVSSIAANAVTNFSAEELRPLQNWRDVREPEYQAVVQKLQEVKERNPGVMYAYILRPTDSTYFYEFVADADSMNIFNTEDYNEDGLVNDVVAPGHLWHDRNPENSAILHAITEREPTADPEPTHDPWGTWIAGHAPIINENGKVAAVIGVDVAADDVYTLTMSDFSPLLYFLTVFVALCSVHVAVAVARSRTVFYSPQAIVK